MRSINPGDTNYLHAETSSGGRNTCCHVGYRSDVLYVRMDHRRLYVKKKQGERWKVEAPVHCPPRLPPPDRLLPLCEKRLSNSHVGSLDVVVRLGTTRQNLWNCFSFCRFCGWKWNELFNKRTLSPWGRGPRSTVRVRVFNRQQTFINSPGSRQNEKNQTNKTE